MTTQSSNQQEMPWPVIAFIFLLILAIILLLVMVFKYRLSEPGECIERPLQYGVARLEEANNKKIICSCFIDGVTLNFDDKSSWVITDMPPSYLQGITIPSQNIS